MKKWFEFFGLSFFSHRLSKSAVKRGYGNVVFAFILVILLLWSGFVGADMLPFGMHYGDSPDFMASVYSLLANPDPDKRVDVEITDGDLKVKKNGEYVSGLIVNTLESEADRQAYAVNGYNLVLDLRPADTPAEFEAYCVSNDGNELEISYDEYLTLSEVARLNFDFKLRYTGRALSLTDGMISDYAAYLDGLGDEAVSAELNNLSDSLTEEKITKDEYNRAIYELYFANYYPDITAYETTSKIPLLRNYYYYNYISEGIKSYLFVFDDYLTGSFETEGGTELSFYGFYIGMENGPVVRDGATAAEAMSMADGFIKDSFGATAFLSVYSYGINVITLLPFIVLMLFVVALLTYSILRLWGVESIGSFGSMVKISGSHLWLSGLVSAICALIASCILGRGAVGIIPLVIFFVILAARGIVFAVAEARIYKEKMTKQTEQQESVRTEV